MTRTYLAHLATVMMLIGSSYVSAEVNASPTGTTVNIHGTVQIPPPCQINNDEVIEVDFGNAVIIEKINADYDKQTLNIHVVCTGTPSGQLQMLIQGTSDINAPSLLKTTTDGLGIAFFANSQAVALDQPVNIELTSLHADFSLVAALKKTGSSAPAEGQFSATGVLVLQVQ